MPHVVHLNFAAAPALRDALSAVMPLGDTLWLANDEAIHLERLSLQAGLVDGNPYYAAHCRFALHDFLQLPASADVKDNEVDVEGLDYHDGHLWLVGSHSLKRSKPKAKHTQEEGIDRLAKVKRDANRYVLARIPVQHGADGLPMLAAPAAQLPLAGKGSALMQALAHDPHLGEFLAIPGKDNGFDIEGIAVAGSRVFLGLRGPVLRGYAVVLELLVRVDPKHPASLQLSSLAKGEVYRKHFLPLAGLGIRDLCVQGEDLLLLAGPTMALDGPVRVYRWRGALGANASRLVRTEELVVAATVPYGLGEDHAEGMALWRQADGSTALLVVYDNAALVRKRGDAGVLADIIPLQG